MDFLPDLPEDDFSDVVFTDEDMRAMINEDSGSQWVQGCDGDGLLESFFDECYDDHIKEEEAAELFSDMGVSQIPPPSPPISPILPPSNKMNMGEVNCLTQLFDHCYYFAVKHFNDNANLCKISNAFQETSKVLGPEKYFTFITEYQFLWRDPTFFITSNSYAIETAQLSYEDFDPIKRRYPFASAPVVPEISYKLTSNEKELSRCLAIMGGAKYIFIEVRTQYSLNRTLFNRVFFHMKNYSCFEKTFNARIKMFGE